MKFLKNIKQRAKAMPKTVVLPETEDLRTLEAADAVLKEGFAKLILIGDEAEILAKAKAKDFDLSKATFINPKTFDKKDQLINKLFELRKNKGLTIEQAEDLILNNNLYFGVMLVNEGIADGMVAGAVNSTANVLRPSLQILKTAKGAKLVSAFLILDVPNTNYGEDGVFLFADCGLNQHPNSEELADIAIASAESFKILLEKEPIVAMLSHSSKGSAKHPDVDKVVNATEIAKRLSPELKLDGELQLDAAIVPEIGKSKAPGSDVSGKANVLIFPDLDAGNISYKLVERLAHAEAYGPILQGIKKPVNDLSRGCSAADIAGVVGITVVQAQALN